jgi:hypothetical protein
VFINNTDGNSLKFRAVKGPLEPSVFKWQCCTNISFTLFSDHAGNASDTID